MAVFRPRPHRGLRADLQLVCIRKGLKLVPSMVGVVPSMVGVAPSMVGADLQSVCIRKGLGVVVGVELGLGRRRDGSRVLPVPYP